MAGRVTFADLLKKAEAKGEMEKPRLEIVPVNIEAKPTPPTSLTLPTPSTPVTKQFIAPERDFARVANSIVRDAVSQGWFIGKSKQVYDFLYLQTRGAVTPKRSVRITKANLMRGSGIGSERTLLKNLSHLKSIGLIKIIEFEGQHGGNQYETFLPEEIESTLPTPPTPRHPPNAQHKVGTLPSVEGGVGGVGLPLENNEDAETLRHNTKTVNKNDDEAFAEFIEVFQSSVRELTGKKLTKRDAGKLKELSELLVLELKIAARRTTNISSIPAFLTEVLRRQFFASRQQKPVSTKPSKTKPDKVGEPEQSSYEIKALDEAGRAEALAQLQEFANDDFLEDFKKWYTPEDWSWLIAELEKGKRAEN